MINQNNKLLEFPTRIVAILAHEDDEIACGGLLSKNVRLGGMSHVICFGGSSKKRKEEFNRSCETLGVSFECLGKKELEYNKDFVRTISYLSKKIAQLKPDFVVTHRENNDYHKDHRDVSKIAREVVIRAQTSVDGHISKGILYSETISLHSIVNLFVDITQEYDKVVRALNFHKSQVEKLEGYYVQELDSKTKIRGVQTGCERAEAFSFEPLPLIGGLNRRNVGI